MNKAKKIVGKLITALWLVISASVVLIPVLWMISAAFTEGKLLEGVPLIPNLSDLSFTHFQYLFTYRSNPAQMFPDYVGAFIRTFQIAAINTVLVIFFSIVTGYVFSRLRFKGRKTGLLTMMVLNMFPSFMGMIALFLLFRTFGFLNKPAYLALIYAAGSIPYNTFLVRGFMRNIPYSLDEAAKIDGASRLQVLTQILLPLIKPIVGFIAVGAFMAPWVDFILQKNFLQKENMTVAVWLYNTTDPKLTQFYNPLRFMAGALLIAVPIMCVQFYMQKFMIHGLTAGADKG
ncbi:MAG: sugar ABC transporter permease [Erysipelotrichaceae bacterium]